MSENDYLSSLRELIKSEMIDVNTSINGEIVSYSNGFATVKPLANKRYKDGDILPYPLIFKVPVRWASFNGGKCGFKAPITAGDKVLIVFSQQAADGSDDMRRFDLTDAYAIPIDNAVTGQGSNNEDALMWFGEASIKITKDGKIIMTAPAGIEYTAPTNDYTGAQTTQGLITGLAGLAITGVSTYTGNTTQTGNVTINGVLLNNGKNIGPLHTHNGVVSGGSTSGVVT